MLWKLASFARRRCLGADAVEKAAARDLAAMGHDRDSIRVAILRQNHKMSVSAEEFAGWSDDGMGGIGALDAAAYAVRSGTGRGDHPAAARLQDAREGLAGSRLVGEDDELGGGAAAALGEGEQSQLHYGFVSLPSVAEEAMES